MAKSEKGLFEKKIGKLSDAVSRELQKATDQIQTVISEFYKQAEGIQKQISDPIKKLIGDIETLRDKKLKKAQEDYHGVLKEIASLQEQVLQKLGLAKKEMRKNASATTVKETVSKVANSAVQTAETVQKKTAASAKKAGTAVKKAASSAKKASVDATEKAASAVKTTVKKAAKPDQPTVKRQRKSATKKTETPAS
jgi:uncharacterized phage protein gp47/JayE